MKSTDKLIAPITLILIVVLLFFTHQVFLESKERQALKIDKAEISSVTYGLLSVFEWKRKVTGILSKKIDEFELTPKNKEQFRGQVQSALYRLIDEVKKVVDKRANEGGAIKKMITGFVVKLALDFNDLKKNVPKFTDAILSELEKKETRENLKKFIQSKLDNVLSSTFGQEDLKAIDKIKQRYNCQSIEECSKIIDQRTAELERSLWIKSVLMTCIVLIIFLLWIMKSTEAKTSFHFYLLVITCLIFLFSGITSPMIDIDARISQLKFTLMGENIIFTDQIIFFQSKSIIDVVTILIKNGELMTILVGILVMTFSVVFPLTKLISIGYVLNRPEKLKNHVLKFIVFESGKWSMADVMVIAIFMSYIGFRGVISSQLEQIQKASESVDVITTNNTSLQCGYLFFIGFCIAGLVLATFAKKHLYKKES